MDNLIKGQTKKEVWLEPRKESIFNVEVDKIRPNPHQPRQEVDQEGLKELTNSIREHGIIQPVLVTKIEKTTERGRQVEYELVAGERRWRAAKKAGLPHVPVIIRDSSANQKLELALVENIQRQDLNPIDRAKAFKRLQDVFGLKHQEIAKKVGMGRPTVSNSIRLLNLAPQIQKAIIQGRITDAHGRAILMAKPMARVSLYRDIIRNNLSIGQAEEKAREKDISNQGNQGRGIGPKNPLFRKLEKELAQAIGRRVSIIQRAGKQYLRIEFAGQLELDELINYLMKI